MSGRYETRSGEGGVILYPSFVWEFAPNSDSPKLEERIDCWNPKRTNDGGQDFVEGVLHCQRALDISRANGIANFLIYVVHAMADKHVYEDIERGFIKLLCRLSLPSARPVIGRFPRLIDIPPDGQKYEEDRVWDFMQLAREMDNPDMLEWSMEAAVRGRDNYPYHAVLLTVVAAAAYAGSLN